jgi:hypothetical protein
VHIHQLDVGMALADIPLSAASTSVLAHDATVAPT